MNRLYFKVFMFFLIAFFVQITAGDLNAFHIIKKGNSHKKTLKRDPLKAGRISSDFQRPGAGIAKVQDFLNRHGQRWHFVWDKTTLSPILASGQGIDMLTEGMSMYDVEGVSRFFVDDNQELLGVSAKDLVLDENSSRQAGPFGEMWFMHFTQLYRDVPVLNTNIFMRYKFGRLIQFGSESFSNIDLDLTPQISGEEGLSIAKREINFNGEADKIESHGELFVYPVKEKGFYSFKLIYKNVFFRAEPYGQWVVYVDAKDGSIIESYTNTYYFRGRLFGQVHPRLATDEYMEVPLENVLVNLGGITDSLTDASGVFGARLSSVNSLTTGLQGPLAYARRCEVVYVGQEDYTRCNSTETKVVFMGNSSWDYEDNLFFHLDDTNTTSQERDAFFYINRGIKWASKYIDIDWFRKSLEINVNIGEMVTQSAWGGMKREKMACNAFFDGRSINFFTHGTYEGQDGQLKECNNTANIADIVLHEWGHGVDANTGGIDDSAFSEGIADFIAASMTQDPRIGVSFKKGDQSLGGSYIREIETDKIYPRDANSDPHLEGLIISSTWWDLRLLLIEKYGFEQGSDISNFLFLNHLFTARKYTDSYAAVLSVDDDNGDLSDLTPNYTEIRRAFAMHGLVEE